jgi:hypothetical protein
MRQFNLIRSEKSILSTDLSCCCYFQFSEQVRYKRWLWWTRFGMAVGALQLVGAMYLMFVIVRDLPNGRRSTSCFFGMFWVGWYHLSVVYFSFEPNLFKSFVSGKRTAKLTLFIQNICWEYFLKFYVKYIWLNSKKRMLPTPVIVQF